ncbi:aldehyde dehydrogenase family protein [Salidesulfovibrio brasiliensis]
MSVEQKLLFAFPERADLPEEYASAIPREYPYYLADGELIEWDGPMEDVYSSMEVRENGESSPLFLGRCPVLDDKAAMRAATAASRAYADGQGQWPRMPMNERIAHLEAFATRMAEVRDEVVRLMTLEICKPRQQVEAEYDRTVEYIGDTVDALREAGGREFSAEQGIFAHVRRAPLGPVLCMGPYNFPYNETFATLIPALVMGNTAVVKLPRIGRLLFTPVIKALRDCFPKGVVNVITGDTHLVHPILESGLMNVFAFIGSSRAANALRGLHPQPHRLRCIFGLDAKNQAVVLPCADMDLAAREILTGSLGFGGQRCTAVKIVFVHRSRADELLDRLKDGIEGLRVGMPFEEGVDITPMPEPGKVDYLKGLVDDALANGARVVNPEGGAFARSLFHPALLYPVTQDMRVYREEQFGPVVPVVPYDDETEPVQYQIHSNFGQQASIFGQDPEAVGRLIDALAPQVCRLNINSKCQRGPDTLPFSGRKDSAEGTLSVRDALRAFSMRSVVAAKDTAANRDILERMIRDGGSCLLNTDHLR